MKVRHIVMWRLKGTDAGEKQASAARAREALESMRGRIPGLLQLEVGDNFLVDANAADLVLCTEHTDRAALLAYQAHPVHEAIKPVIRDLTLERRVVDYEV